MGFLILRSSSAGGAGNTISQGSEYLHLNFTNLTSGQSITSMVDEWGTQGTGTFTDRQGCYGDTSVKRTGKNSSLRIEIAARTTGRPGDDPATPEGSGDWGFQKLLPAPVTQGGTIRIGAWVRVPAGYDWGSDQDHGSGWNGNAGAGHIKFLRLEKRTSGGVPDGRVEFYVLNGLIFSDPEPDQVGWYSFVEDVGQVEAETKHKIDTAHIFQDDTWHWIELYVKVHATGALAERRAWIDGVLIHEQLGASFKYRNTSGTYTTQTWSAAIPTLDDSGGDINRLYVFTYWNGGAPQDQSLYLSDIVFSNNNENASDLVTDSFGNKMIGSSHV